MSDSFGLAFAIFLLVLLLLFSAFFSCSEVALFSLSSMKVKVFRADVDRRKQLVAHLLSSPRDLIITILALNVITNILFQNVLSNVFSAFSAWILHIGLPLVLTLIFGEMIPKSVGLANNDAISYRVAPCIYRLQKFFFPVRKILVAITQFLMRLLFFFLKKEPDISVDELEHALKASRQLGVLNEEEAELIQGYLQLSESQVKEWMRPRADILFFDLEEPLAKLVHMFVDQQCSRVPICQKNLDAVVGIMTSQIYFLHKEKLHQPKDMIAILQKPFFVPEMTSAPILLRQMLDKQEFLALVVDEYGSVSGLITLEDLVETVVGEIADARDEKADYTSSDKGMIIASGKLELSEFEKIFGIALPSINNMITLGGWLTEQIGDIPKAGFKYMAHGFLFHVLASDHKRVHRIYVRQLKASSSKGNS
ncbi:MAG: hemolysin family protein [Chlamydiales bacterium]|jgi:CBS domain containing-hemolysin-like protein|nr:hemolysin family protein [Chlamydiales bacterium]